MRNTSRIQSHTFPAEICYRVWCDAPDGSHTLILDTRHENKAIETVERLSACYPGAVFYFTARINKPAKTYTYAVPLYASEEQAKQAMAAWCNSDTWKD